MFEHAKPAVMQAEAAAAGGAKLPEVLKLLRRLGLDDFGLLLLSMPNAEYPHLSKVLPKMASEATQKQWAGSCDVTLLKQTTLFSRQLAYTYQRYSGRQLDSLRILDFGCGFGRLIRMMYYFTDPDRIYGIDPWDRSINICESDGVLANYGISERVPQKLPVNGTKFDLAYACSVFTHLSQKAAMASFGAIRQAMQPDGIFIATIRPVEFWQYFDKIKNSSNAINLERVHKETGFAYQEHPGVMEGTYGDASISLPFMERIPGWKMVGYDRSLGDSYQIVVAMKPA